MASKKDKFLDNAQRFILKGQIDRAIREYQHVVALEPGENRHRQKLAELLVKDGRRAEAIEQYEDIARNYAENSHFLKAIAVYKQIQRLAPGDIRIVLTLASLNHKQGLVGNALAEYGQVVAAFEKEGSTKKAIEVLEQMISIDGQNLSTRLKHAECLRKIGERERAYSAFADILGALRLRGDAAGAEKFSQRLNQMYPEKAKQESGAPSSFKLEWSEPEEPATATDKRGPAPRSESAKPVPPAELELSLEDEPSAFPTPAGRRTVASPPAAGRGPELTLSLDDELSSPSPRAAAPLAESRPADAAPAETVADEPYWEVEIELDFDEGTDQPPAVASGAGTEEGIGFVETDGRTESRGAACCAPTAAIASSPENAGHDGFFPDEGLEWLELDDGPVSGGDVAAPGGAPVSGEAQRDPGVAAFLDGGDESLLEDALDWLDEGSAVQDETGETAAAARSLQPADVSEGDRDLRCQSPVTTEGGSQLRTLSPAAGVAAASGPALTWGDLFPEWEQPADAADLAELESHYDLGLAYKEMGLYREAIRELSAAGRNPRRRVDSLTFQALCYRDLGEVTKSEDLLRKGRTLAGISTEERMWLGYELATVCEGAGKVEEAVELYHEVYAWDPGFQDVARKLGNLCGSDFEEIELEEDL